MDELTQALALVPKGKQAAIRSWWTAQVRKGHDASTLLGQVRAKYAPTPTATIAVPAAEATATTPNLPMMAPTIEADQGGPRVPVGALPRPGAVRSFGNAVLNTLPFADEAAAALSTGQVSGPGYETARRLAEYQLGRGATDHPTATGLGTVTGLGGLSMLGAPEAIGAEAGGRQFARNILQNAGIGAVYGAGASDPGRRMLGGTVGAVTGGALGLGGAAVGELAGRYAGTPQGRAARDIALKGETPLAASQALVERTAPDAPLTAADVLGPFGPSRVRAGVVTPGPAQDIYKETYLTRQATRPNRVQGAIEAETGNFGRNPYAVMEGLQEARGDEATRLYNAALYPNNRDVLVPAERITPLLRIPKIRNLIDEYRAIAEDAGAKVNPIPQGAPGWAKVTGRELQYVKRRLSELGESLAPGEAALTQAKGSAAQSLLGSVTRILREIPGYAEADAAYQRRSSLMAAHQFGAKALQSDPALVEHTVGNYTPNELEGFRLGFPASTAKAIETGSARGVLTRLGLGETPRLGRQRILDRVFPGSENRLARLLQQEEVMLPAERATEAAAYGSQTATNEASKVESAISGLSFGIPGLIRREALGVLRAPPSPEALTQEARMLTTGAPRGVVDRPALQRLVNEAQGAETGRGDVRRGFHLFGRALSAGLPTVGRLETDRQRTQRQDAYDELIAAGATPERALDLVQRRFP